MWHLVHSPDGRCSQRLTPEVSMTSFDTHEEQMHKETLRESQKRMSEEEVQLGGTGEVQFFRGKHSTPGSLQKIEASLLYWDWIE